MNIHLPQTEEARAEAGASSGTSGTLKYPSFIIYGLRMGHKPMPKPLY